MSSRSPYCYAPWVHSHVDPQGNRRICCVAKGDKGIKSRTEFGEFWNSEYMKGIRKKMLKGEAPSECLECEFKDRSIGSYRSSFTERFRKFQEVIIQDTHEDGSYSALPISLDYRFSNACNFKCRMCGPYASSSFQKEEVQYGDYFASEVEQLTRKEAEAEFDEIISRSEIQNVYWGGGEPLLYPHHWDFVTKAVESGRSQTIEMEYNTNLSIVRYKGNDWFELIKKFKHIRINASLDGVADVGSYIRTGLVWDQWLSCFNLALEVSRRHKHIELLLDVTLSIPSILYFDELLRFINAKKCDYIFKGCIPGGLMSARSIPKSLRREFLSQVKSYLVKTLSHEISPRLLKDACKTLDDIASQPDFSEMFGKYEQQELARGKSEILKLEERRKHSLTFHKMLSRFPILLSWWDSIDINYRPQSLNDWVESSQLENSMNNARVEKNSSDKVLFERNSIDNANILNNHFSSMSLSDNRIKDSFLQASELETSKVEQCSLISSNIIGLKLSEARLENVTFDSCELEGIAIENCYIKNHTFKNINSSEAFYRELNQVKQ